MLSSTRLCFRCGDNTSLLSSKDLRWHGRIIHPYADHQGQFDTDFAYSLIKIDHSCAICGSDGVCTKMH